MSVKNTKKNNKPSGASLASLGGGDNGSKVKNRSRVRSKLS